MSKTGRLWFAVVGLAAGALAVWSGENEAREAIRQADIAFSKATVERRLEGFSSFIAEEVTTIRPNQPLVRGKRAFVDGWAPLLNNASRGVTWQPLLAEASSSGDLGYSVGKAEWTKSDAQGTRVVATGKYITIWRKQKDGSWKVVFDSGIQDKPPDTK